MHDRGRRPLHVSSLTSMNHFDNDFLQLARHKSVIGVESPDVGVSGSSTLIDSVRVRSFCCSSLTARKVDKSESNKNGDMLDGDVGANSEVEGGVKQTASTADEVITLLDTYYSSLGDTYWRKGHHSKLVLRIIATEIIDILIYHRRFISSIFSFIVHSEFPISLNYPGGRISRDPILDQLNDF